MSQERLVVMIPRTLKESVRASARAQGTTITEITTTALEEYLNPDDYKVASLRYMAEQSRKLDKLLKREETILETLGRFILVYLHHTPPLPPHEAPSAQREAAARYQRFIEKLSRSLAANRTFLASLDQVSTDPNSFYFDELEEVSNEP